MLSLFSNQNTVPFASLESINKEQNRLENLVVISPVDYRDWSSLTFYVKKKNSKIRVYSEIERQNP